MTEELEIQLEQLLNKLNLKKKNIDVLAQYINLLKRWNKKINLISKKESDIVNNLVTPSLLFFDVVENVQGLNIFDIGSGAGFPAIILKIYEPALSITLIDSNSKKVAFLRYVAAYLRLSVQIINENLFNLDENTTQKVNMVTTRGVKITPQILNWIKTKTKSRWIVHFTSPKIHLPLDLIKEKKINLAAVKLYSVIKQEG